ELAKPDSMGKVSGWGWSFGYFGGMLTLGICLAYVIWAQGQKIPASEFVPVTMLITAAIYGLASLVTFWLLKERGQVNVESLAEGGFIASLHQLRRTARQARRYTDFKWLMACAVFYQGGIAVAIALAAVYAEQEIGFKPQETMVLIFVLNLAAAAGSFAWGYLQDRVGHKRALGATLVGWTVVCVLAAASSTKLEFWVACTIAGLCMGSSQSAGRALAGVFAPPLQRAEFYGLWTFALRLASIIGPLSYGTITWVTGGNQRLAILSTAGLFIMGLVILTRVNVERGRQAALMQSGP
ncbi:MAG: MFS transporter, partial [Ramlibacter sp.]|nr:MFS transporter [Ramlibacter sp.]